MSYTKIIENQQNCNYINPMKDNAEAMLNPCINNPNIKPDYNLQDPGNLCTGKAVEQTEYHNFYDGQDQIKFTEQFNDDMLSDINNRKDHIIQRQRDLIKYLNTDNNNIQVNFENYNKDVEKSGSFSQLDKPINIYDPKPEYPTYVPPNKVNISEDSRDCDLIEGFVSGDFLSDNGPGEQYVDVCPDEYEMCSKTNLCKKKCDHCKTEYNDSDYTDICYPNNYDGIDNFGRIMCSRTKNIDNNIFRISTQLSHINSKEQLFSHHDHHHLYKF